MSANQWMYLKNGQQLGPVTEDQLKAMAAQGQLQPSDFVWREGLPEWIPMSKTGLLAVHAPAPPPPVAVAIPFSPAAAVQPVLALGPGLSKKQRLTRILLIVAAGVLFASFFTPLFYVKAKGASEGAFGFGWDFWYGIITFIFSILALAAAILDLVIWRITFVRLSTKWVHLGCYGICTLISALGFILSLCAIGMDIPKFLRPSISCIPITAPLLVLGSGLGLFLAIRIVLGEKE